MNLYSLYLESVLEKKENLQYFEKLFLDESFQEFLSSLNLNKNTGGIFGSTYVVKRKINNEKVGFVSFGDRVEKNDCIATSLYYGVDRNYRGQKLGQLILNEVSQYLLETKLVNLIVVNVDKKNKYSIATIENCKFVYQPDFSDDEDLQYHRK